MQAMRMGSVGRVEGEQAGPVHELEKWSRAGRKVEAEILRHLARVDELRLCSDAAYSSLAAYCMGHLGYSEQMAYKRIRVARLSREIPEILDAIAAGRATVCGLCAVASYVTAQNAAEWIARIAGKTKRAIEELAAMARVEAGRPAPAPRPMIRALPSPAPHSPQPAQTLPATHSPRPSAGLLPPPANHGSRPAPTAATEVLHRLAVTVTTAVSAKLDRAVALMRHALPSGDLGAVIERALDALIATTEKRRFGAASARRAAKSNGRTRRIPASMRRALFERDGGACAYVDAEGRRCGCAQGVELHHVAPYARGGANTAENLRVYCRAHNQRQGERDFGPRAR